MLEMCLLRALSQPLIALTAVCTCWSADWNRPARRTAAPSAMTSFGAVAVCSRLTAGRTIPGTPAANGCKRLRFTARGRCAQEVHGIWTVDLSGALHGPHGSTKRVSAQLSEHTQPRSGQRRPSRDIVDLSIRDAEKVFASFPTPES